MSDTLKTYTQSSIIQDIKDRFFPRKLILTDDHLANALYRTLDKLETFCYNPRYYELPKTNNYLDLSQVEVAGTEVKKVIRLYPASQLQSIFNVYTQLMGNTPFYFNIIRNQDLFIEFMLTKQVNDQMNRKFKNKQTGFFQVDDKLYFDQTAFNDTESMVIEFYPGFKRNRNSWELYKSEYVFLGDYLEAMVMYREGRGQSELNFTDLNTNSEKFQSEGSENMKDILENFRQSALKRIGKRF